MMIGSCILGEYSAGCPIEGTAKVCGGDGMLYGAVGVDLLAAAPLSVCEDQTIWLRQYRRPPGGATEIIDNTDTSGI